MRRATIFPLMLAATLFAACDSGGGGSVDCAIVPTHPLCQAAANDVVGGGNSDVRTGGSDATATTQDTSTNGVGDFCSGNAKRCVDLSAQTCQNGVFVEAERCTTACQFGTCKDPAQPDCSCAGKVCGDDGCGNSCGFCSGTQTCTSLGQCEGGTTTCSCAGRTCGDDGCGNSCGTCPPNATCNLSGQCISTVTCTCNGNTCGLDNCGNSCGTCTGNTACVAGQCQGVSNPGGDDCVDILDCIFPACADLTDDAQAAACEQSCVLAGDAVAQQEFNDYLGCAIDCGADSFCFANNCSSFQAACFFDQTGFGGCVDIAICFDTCGPTDNPCYEACYEASTAAAQTALLTFNNCLNAACPDAAAGDPCIDAAVANQCAAALANCQSL